MAARTQKQRAVPAKARLGRALKRYGVPREDYLQRQETQAGKCAVCKFRAPILYIDLAIDGNLRGLICGGCRPYVATVVALGDGLDDLVATIRAYIALPDDSYIDRNL